MSNNRLPLVFETEDQRARRQLWRGVAACLCVAVLSAAFIGLAVVLR